MGRRLKSQSALPIEAPEVGQQIQQDWPITEVLRVRCPVCGMLANEEAFEAGPHGVQVLLQRFGGSFPAVGGNKKRGLMQYLDDFPGQPEQLEKWTAILQRKIQEALEEFGG